MADLTKSGYFIRRAHNLELLGLCWPEDPWFHGQISWEDEFDTLSGRFAWLGRLDEMTRIAHEEIEQMVREAKEEIWQQN